MAPERRGTVRSPRSLASDQYIGADRDLLLPWQLERPELAVVNTQLAEHLLDLGRGADARIGVEIPATLEGQALGEDHAARQVGVLLVVVGLDGIGDGLEVCETRGFEEAAGEERALLSLVDIGLEFEIGLKLESGITLRDPAEVVRGGEVEVDGKGEGARVGRRSVVRMSRRNCGAHHKYADDSDSSDYPSSRHDFSFLPFCLLLWVVRRCTTSWK